MSQYVSINLDSLKPMHSHDYLTVVTDLVAIEGNPDQTIQIFNPQYSLLDLDLGIFELDTLFANLTGEKLPKNCTELGANHIICNLLQELPKTKANLYHSAKQADYTEKTPGIYRYVNLSSTPQQVDNWYDGNCYNLERNFDYESKNKAKVFAKFFKTSVASKPKLQSNVVCNTLLKGNAITAIKPPHKLGPVLDIWVYCDNLCADFQQLTEQTLNSIIKEAKTELIKNGYNKSTVACQTRLWKKYKLSLAN